MPSDQENQNNQAIYNVLKNARRCEDKDECNKNKASAGSALGMSNTEASETSFKCFSDVDVEPVSGISYSDSGAYEFGGFSGRCFPQEYCSTAFPKSSDTRFDPHTI